VLDSGRRRLFFGESLFLKIRFSNINHIWQAHLCKGVLSIPRLSAKSSNEESLQSIIFAKEVSYDFIRKVVVLELDDGLFLLITYLKIC
jgi:hypothetical protein